MWGGHSCPPIAHPYWHCVNATTGAFTVPPAVTVCAVVFCSDGLQFAVFDEFGTNASASTTKVALPVACVYVVPLALNTPRLGFIAGT